jgi:multimeric flavodoxin WrbA
MRILGILGSPRLEGNSADLLEAALEGARRAGAETERVNLSKMRIDPCMECRGCDLTSQCVRRVDEMSVIYQKIREVDGIALSSPIFFMGVTAQTKAMIDRCQSFWVERFVLKHRPYEGRRRPKGAFLSCAGGQKMTAFEPALHEAKAFFSAIDYEYIGEVLLAYTDDSELRARKDEALEKARALGMRLCD